MGRWANLKGTLRSEPVPETYQSKIDAVKREEFWEQAPGMLGEKYKALKLEKDKLNEKASAIELRMEAIRQLLLEWMANQGINNFKLASGGTLYEIGAPAPKLVDNEKFNAWLSKHYPDLHRNLRIHSMTLTSLVKEIFEHDGEIPPGVDVTYRMTLGMRGADSGEKE